MGCLYKLTSPSRKSYIGITSRTLEKRWIEHVKDARSGRWGALFAAIRKYGAVNFKLEILAIEDDWPTLCELECAAIKSNGTFGKGYNATPGGDGVAQMTEASRKRHRKRTIEGTHKAMQKPSYFAQLSRKKAYLNRPDLKEAARLRTIALQSDPAYREKVKRGMARTKIQRSESVKLAWSDPEKRSRLNRKWTDPTMRKMMLEALRNAGQRPEVRRHHSLASQKLWRNPEFRFKNTNGREARNEIKETNCRIPS